MGKVKYTEEDLQNAAITFKNDLTAIPVLSISETTKFMHVQTGVRFEELVGAKSTNAKFRPRGKGGKKADDVDLNLLLRKLKTYVGELTANFDPNQTIQTIIGHKASQASGDELETTASAQEVLALIAKDASEDLIYVLWMGELDPTSDDPEALFDGFDTITIQEISAGEISEKKGNLLKINETITVDNIMSVCERIIDAMNIRLRRQDCFLFCPQWFADMYNRAYKKESAGISYNDKYEQVYVEGSNKKLTLAPVEGKEGSQFFHISPKINMLVGCDQESDLDNVKVKEYQPRILTMLMDLIMGVQFRCIHSSQLLVVQHTTRVEKPILPSKLKDELIPDDETTDEP